MRGYSQLAHNKDLLRSFESADSGIFMMNYQESLENSRAIIHFDIDRLIKKYASPSTEIKIKESQLPDPCNLYPIE